MPMGKAIRFDSFCIIILILVLSLLFVKTGYTQISITDTESFGVSFTDRQTSASARGIEISVDDPVLVSDRFERSVVNRFTSSKEKQEGLFFVEAQGYLSVGSYYHRSAENILTQFPFINATGNSLSKLSVAFDFLFLSEQTNQSTQFYLSYRINEGEWIQPGEGTISTEFLRSSEQEWGTFSMQISLDQLFLKPDDRIDLRWSSTPVNGEDSFLPLALQSIEIYPTVAEHSNVRPGSLIITELLPLYQTESGYIEYVELYNSTDSPINLKGLILEAGFDEIIIQKDLVAEPYSTVLIAGYGGINGFDSLADYRYSKTLLGNLSGRLELRFSDQEIAKALFDFSEPGVAHQLDHLKNAYDGYSSMRHFEPVSSEFKNNLYGTPGILETSRKLYSTTIHRKGWHLISPPGHLSKNFNRDVGDNFGSILMNASDNDEGESQTAPYLYLHELNEPVTMYSIGTDESKTYKSDYWNAYSRELNLSPLHLSAEKSVSIDQIVNRRGVQAYPALLTWSSENQSFELIVSENDIIRPWDALFAGGEGEVEQDYETMIAPQAEDERPGTSLIRSLQMILSSESGSDESLPVDRAVMGFWNKPSGAEEIQMDLPKLWNPISDEKSQYRSPIIYLKSAELENSTNSYLNFESTPPDIIQVSVGVRFNSPNGRYRISWEDLNTLPDHWELEFVDAELDEVINMRREHSYTFTERSEEVLAGMNNASLNFQPVEQTDYNRFFVRISATGSLGMFERNEQSPDSIELKQNYPNPFNPSTTVVFYLPNAAHAKVSVYNVVGQQVGVLKDERLPAGEHTVIWNAMDMPSGVYIVQLEAGNSVNTRKITLIK